MRGKRGVKVESVAPGGAAEGAGIRKGDSIEAVNGGRVSDVIDYMFHCTGPEPRLAVQRRGRRFTVELPLAEGHDPGIQLKRFKINTCRNNCLFCFVSQLPRGLRKSLYVRDEDYRMSFLHGNYITLTNLSAEDKKRIASQRLSPLYISVHTTDRALRGRMLGNPGAPDIMDELGYLKQQRIRMHTQVVLCPGLNDGGELKKTIRDLCSLYPYVQSIAVVPVGLTAHRKEALRPVEKEDAERALKDIEAFRKRFRKKHGDPIVHAADEMYIKAGSPFPPLKEYGELHQVENGVGMVPLFLSRAKRISPRRPLRWKKALTFTGASFYPYLKGFTDRMRRHGAEITLVRVENSFFGSPVTVTGLLTGRDVIKTLSAPSRGHDLLVIPNAVLREGEDVFLDGVTVSDVENALGIRTAIVEPTPEGLLKEVSEKIEDNRKD
jgi:putative radical SAM enzyme (TIGR03279 family)